MADNHPVLQHRFWRNARTVMLLGVICTMGGCLTMLRSLKAAGSGSDEYAFIKGIIIPHILIMIGLAVVLFGIGMMVRQSTLGSRIRAMQEDHRKKALEQEGPDGS